LDSLVAALAERLVPALAQRLSADADQLLDRPALAGRLGVGQRTVGAMVARQELPPPLLCTGGVSRWSWPQVVKFLESRQGKQRRRGRGRHVRGHVVPAERQGGDRA
jgi:hypothetical protein